MVKAKFEVGESEKHLIAVNANPILKYIRVEVDGERVINVANLTPSRELQLEVGKAEMHHLEIKIRAFSPIKLFADGKEIQQI
ncbi:MAG: hypothetical protein QXN26_06240 [Thermoplasmataceae archaeon]